MNFRALTLAIPEFGFLKNGVRIIGFALPVALQFGYFR
jgi:hypothetical protein